MRECSPIQKFLGENHLKEKNIPGVGVNLGFGAGFGLATTGLGAGTTTAGKPMP